MVDSLSMYSTASYNLPVNSYNFKREEEVKYVIHEETGCPYVDCDVCVTREQKMKLRRWYWLSNKTPVFMDAAGYEYNRDTSAPVCHLFEGYYCCQCETKTTIIPERHKKLKRDDGAEV